MSGSLKEELLKLGLGRASAAEPKRRDGRKHGKEQRARRERRGNEEEECQPARSQPSTAQPRPLSARQQREIEREREARRVRLRERVDAIRLDDPQAEIKHYFSTGTNFTHTQLPTLIVLPVSFAQASTAALQRLPRAADASSTLQR